MQMDRPEAVAELRAAFERYEQALVTNDVAALDALFVKDARTIRYGVGENLYGFAEIAAIRPPARRMAGTRTVGYGDHHIWPRFRGGVDAISPRRQSGHGRTPDADMGAVWGANG